ncbi:MAG: sulfate ABC transporter permease subunit CysT [Chloroflexota bacterium]|jgi:sulfate transport system permease protein|nr:sulfate ABC transporter permease subunit CysT [Chloroflexota bacterium]
MERSLAQSKQKAGLSPWLLRLTVILYLCVMIVVPLIVIIQDGFREGLSELWHQITLPIASHAILLTLWTSTLMTIINTVMGLVTAYVLVRYEFPGKRILNAIIDLPLSIPTLVTGVMLVMLYGPQQALGAFLSEKIGGQIIFAPPGIVLALLFISFPFVVRNIQPVLEDIDLSQEEAAFTLGANSWMTFRRVVLPQLLLPMLSGSLLSFSRAIGEFGAVVIVAGNIPLKTQTAAVYVLGAVESENRLGASAVSILLIAISLLVLIAVNHIQKHWGAHR